MAEGTAQASESKGGRGIWSAGIVVVVLSSLAFLAPWWNHFLALRSGGGGYVPGSMFLHGVFPYRDLYIPSPPLYILRTTPLLMLFGDQLIVMRAFGVFERVALGLFAYLWLSRLFKPGPTTIAATAAVILCSGNFADPVDAYTHESILFFVMSGWVASFALDNEHSKRFVLTAILSGIFAGLSLLGKQSIGAFAVVTTPVIMAACVWRQKRNWLSFLLYYAAGLALPMGALAVWLVNNGILMTFLDQVFVRAPTAKAGSPFDYIRREILILEMLWGCAVIALVQLILLRSASSKADENDEEAAETDARRDSKSAVWKHFAAILAALAIGNALAYLHPNPSAFTIDMSLAVLLIKTAAYLTLFSSFVLTLKYAWRWFTNKLTQREMQLFLLSSVSAAIVLTNSLSAPLVEELFMPALGLVAAIALQFGGKRTKVFTYISCLILLAGEIDIKMTAPHNFEDFGAPSISRANVRSTLPQLAGFELPAQTVDFVDGTVKIIRENTKPGDTIFIYPELALFYPLSGRNPPTLAGCHNMDIMNDKFAKQEAERLLAKRPAVLIYYREHELLKKLEKAWRSGKSSGNRAIIDACEKLASEYRPVKTYHYANKDIMIFLRPQPTDSPSKNEAKTNSLDGEQR
ncbi:MAG TPA: hypothetical protein V6C97_37170 [Oculatellaceae cyanobacterium]